jgi:hypothetical protein
MQRPFLVDFAHMNWKDRSALIVCGLSWAIGNLASYIGLAHDPSDTLRWLSRIAMVGFICGGIWILRRSQYLWSAGMGEWTMAGIALGGFSVSVIAFSFGWDVVGGAGFVTGIVTSGAWFAIIANDLRKRGRWLWPAATALGFWTYLVMAAAVGDSHGHAVFAVSALVVLPLIGWGLWPGRIHDMQWDALRWWPRVGVATFNSWLTIGVALCLLAMALGFGAVVVADGLQGHFEGFTAPVSEVVVLGILLIPGRYLVWRATVTAAGVRLNTVALTQRTIAAAEIRSTEISSSQGVITLKVCDQDGHRYLLMCDGTWLDSALRQLVRHAAAAGAVVEDQVQ